MKQSSSLTRKLTAAQDRPLGLPPILPNQAIVYRLYTEDTGTKGQLSVVGLVSRYFKGATFLFGKGLWNSVLEQSLVIEIIGSAADLQSIVHLAGDIRQVNSQFSVLVTWNNVSLLNVTADV
jgi:hypothetical protein